MPRTKIVCTIGPASESEEALRALIRAGMDIWWEKPRGWGEMGA